MLIGITGPIGSGKTAVTNLLVRKGALIVDADKIGKQVTGSPVTLKKLVATWDKSILTKSGNLRTARLAELVFGDESGEELERFNKIIQAPLGKAISAEIRRAEERLKGRSKPAPVVLDAALLPDWDIVGKMNLVVLVSATRKVRMERLLLRGMSEADATARMRRQSSLKRYREVSNIEISNNSTFDDLAVKVENLWQRRILPMLLPLL